MQPKLVRGFLISFVAGVALAAFIKAALILSAVFISAWSIFKFKNISFGVLLLGLVLGITRAYFVEKIETLPADFEARVSKDTAPSEFGAVTEVNYKNQSFKVYTDRYPEFQAGDKVKVFPRGGLGENSFVKGKMELVAPAGASVFSGLAAIRRGFLKGLQKVMPEPQASFAAGTVIGGSSGLPKELKDKFRSTGLSHILSASGSNFSLLLIFLAFLLRSFALRKQMIIYLLAIPSFAIIAGGSAAVIRAAVMIGLTNLAILSGRRTAAKNVLLWAGATLLLFNPGLLKLDLGFQLSFLASLGLIYVVPIFEKLANVESLSKVKKFGLGLVFATISAQIATAPLIAYDFGTVSLSALPVNLLVVPFIPVVMMLTSAAAFAGLITAGLGQVVAAPLYLLCSYIFKVVDTFSGFAWSEIILNFSKPALFATYLALLAIVSYFYLKLRHKHA